MDFIQDSGKRARIFAAIITASISGSMLATALSTALPQMIEEFGISMTLGQWVTSGFSLTMAIMMPLTAFLIKKVQDKEPLPVGLNAVHAWPAALHCLKGLHPVDDR